MKMSYHKGFGSFDVYSKSVNKQCAEMMSIFNYNMTNCLKTPPKNDTVN